MSLKIKVFGTGSKGNCYQITTSEFNFLIDVGVSIEHVRKFTDLTKIEQVFISHEHNDHVGYLETLIKNFPKIKIIMSEKTAAKIQNMNNLWTSEKWKFFIKSKIITNNNFWEMIPASHDSIDCQSFIFNLKNSILVYVTDTGKITDELKTAIKKLPKLPIYLMVEANYCTQKILFNNNLYTSRVASDRGHLSNEQAAEFIKFVKPFWFGLIHGSSDNNGNYEVFKDFENGEVLKNGWEKRWE